MLVGGGGTQGHFEVWVPDLQTGATDLATDSAEAASAASAGSGGASSASGACGGGQLAGALAQLATRLTTSGGDLADALAIAGLRLTVNAETYLGDDTSAGSALAGWSPGGSSTW